MVVRVQGTGCRKRNAGMRQMGGELLLSIDEHLMMMMVMLMMAAAVLMVRLWLTVQMMMVLLLLQMQTVLMVAGFDALRKDAAATVTVGCQHDSSGGRCRGGMAEPCVAVERLGEQAGYAEG